jgi:isochorismate synthase
MPRFPQNGSSLSLAEPTIVRSLDEWIDSVLAAAVTKAKRAGAPALHVDTWRLEGGIWSRSQALPPFRIFDSTMADAFFLGTSEETVIGLGVARAFEPGSPLLAGGHLRDVLDREGSLGDDDDDRGDLSKVAILGGWGFPFASGSRRSSSCWHDYAPSRWVIPAVTLTSKQGDDSGTLLTLAVYARPASTIAALRGTYLPLIDALRSTPQGSQPGREEDPTTTTTTTTSTAVETDPASQALPALEASKDIPSRREWLSVARKAIDSISRGELKKVVLSRAVSLTFKRTVPPSIVLQRLVSLNPDATVFAVKRRDTVFLGATPESLMSMRGGKIQVDCLAASSPRSKDKQEDDRLGARLLEDGKSRSEHQFVVQAAVSALAPISSSVEVPDGPELKTLMTIHHLSTPVRARLLEGVDAWAASLALWPNPAIAGEPWSRAVTWIRRHERMGRGWFSGVVGLISPRLDEAKLVIGIRSGIICGRKAVIYAGAGLIAGSEPAAEFEETGWKLRTMRRALGIEDDEEEEVEDDARRVAGAVAVSVAATAQAPASRPDPVPVASSAATAATVVLDDPRASRRHRSSRGR